MQRRSLADTVGALGDASAAAVGSLEVQLPGAAAAAAAHDHDSEAPVDDEVSPLRKRARGGGGGGGGGASWVEDEEVVVESGVVGGGHKEFALNNALAESGGSMEEVMRGLGQESLDRLLESLPVPSFYVGGRPSTVAATRERLMRIDGIVQDSVGRPLQRRDVTHIPMINLHGSSAHDPWQRDTGRGVALASGHSRAAAAAAAAVPNAATWIEATRQLEPMLNHSSDAVHPFVMHARITGALARYARARWMSTAKSVRANEIWATEQHHGAAAAAAAT